MFRTIDVKTSEKYQMIEILEEIKKIVLESGVLYGLVCIHLPHTTAALTLTKNYDPVVADDILYKMNSLVPKEGDYKDIEGNSAALIKTSMFGSTETLIIENGRLELGMFQSLYLCEFDGPRKRKVNVKVITG